jgi:flagellar biosynthesis protein FliP
MLRPVVVSLPLKLTFVVPADGWSPVAGSPVHNCGGRDGWRL